MLKTITLLGCLLSVHSLWACLSDQHSHFLPANAISIPLNSNSIMTLEKFQLAIDKVEALYSPIVSRLGKKLSIERRWKDPKVAAQASQTLDTFHVKMFGGFARHPKMTQDGLSLALCHEIGHHLGGAVKKIRSQSGNRIAYSWSSAEGQADYWATLKCLRKVFYNDNNETIITSLNAPSYVQKQCTQAHQGHPREVALCIRIAMAGKAVADLFADLEKKGEVAFETKSPVEVLKTNEDHTSAQCRLDTYFQGALCPVDVNIDVDDRDETQGTCHALNGHEIGLRPACWFKAAKL